MSTDTSEMLAMLQEKGEDFAKRTVVEKKRLKDLDDAIEHITKETEKYRTNAKKFAIKVLNKNVPDGRTCYQKADGVNVGREAAQQTKKTLTMTEMNLNRLLVRRAEIDVENQKLKSEVDHMRRLRMQTDLSQKKFEVVLYDTKAQIEQFLSESTAVIDERDRLMKIKESLEVQNVEEQKIFEEEFEELGKYIKDQNDALENALLHDRKDNAVEKTLAESMPQGNFDEEDKMAGKVSMLASYAKNEQSSHEQIHRTIREYEAMFEELKTMTSTTSLKEIISSYSTNEEEMFSLYSYIQSMNSETETMIESISKLEAEVVSYKQEQERMHAMEDQHRAELDYRLQAAKDAVQAALESHKSTVDGVDQITKKVQSIFFKLQCDQMDNAKPIEKPLKGKAVTVSKPESKIALLTGQGSISEANVMSYLAIIEQRTIEIISEYIRDHHKEGLPTSPTPGPITPMIPRSFSVPMVDVREINEEDMFDLDESDVRPFDTIALKNSMNKKALRSLTKNAGGGGANPYSFIVPSGGSPHSQF